MPASVLVCLAAFGAAGTGNTTASVTERVAPSPADDTKLAVRLPAIAFIAADIAAVDKPLTKDPAEAQALHEAAPQEAVKNEVLLHQSDLHEPDPIVTAALTNPSEVLPAETPPKQMDESNLASREPGDTDPAVGSPEVLDQCSTDDACIDRYLWQLYQRTPKEDAIRVQEQRKVAVKKRGRLVTVTRTFTTVTDEDFSWKDPKAADKAGMPAADYVIGGIDRDFKLKLFRMLRAADQAGLSPGITSGFRDDYRQSIASGLKAANDRSYHGGSSHGGYGHGLAADIVGVNGETRAQRLSSSDVLWRWVDAHGKEFGIGRPYLDRDPPHVAPIDGKEYADHHPGMRARQAAAAKPHSVVASRDHHAARRTRTAS